MKEINKDVIISKKEVDNVVSEMFSSLLDCYVDLLQYYNELPIALRELEVYENEEIDDFIRVSRRLEYIGECIDQFRKVEKEIFVNNIAYIDDFLIYIKKLNGIKLDQDLENFSYFDALTKFRYSHLENQYIMSRMIRASYFYQKYVNNEYDVIKQIEEQLEETDADLMIESINEDDLIDTVSPDLNDVLAINTINYLNSVYSDELSYTNYKAILSFINPFIENLYLSNDFIEDNPLVKIKTDKKSIRLFENNIIDALFAIQKNDFINTNTKSKKLYHRTYSIKQLFEIFFKFNKKEDEYESRINKYVKYRENSLEKISLMHSYLLANFSALDQQSIRDLDHLLSVMSDNGSLTRGNVTLCKKITDAFFSSLIDTDDDDIVEKDELFTRKKNKND